MASSGKQPMSRAQLDKCRPVRASDSSEDDDSSPVGDRLENLGLRTAILTSKNDLLLGENVDLQETIGAQQERNSELEATAAAELKAKEQERAARLKAEAETAALKEQLANYHQAQAHLAALELSAAAAAPPQPAPSAAELAELLNSPAVEAAVSGLREAMAEGGTDPGVRCGTIKWAIQERHK